MLHYALYDNELTTDALNDKVARPVDVVNHQREELVTEMTGPGSILKTTEVNAVINSYWSTIGKFLRQGETYNDEYISTRFDISGVFLNDDDRFDASRHTLTASIRFKPKMSSTVDDVDLKKVDGNKIQPEIKSIYDWGSDSYDQKLTSGDVLEISGENLKIHNNMEDQEGVFFVNQSDGTEVRQDKFRMNEPKTLTLRVPELTAGNYRMEVRNSSRNGKTLRVGLFTPVLTSD